MSATVTAGHWASLELAAGQRVLIEASAGTGKTWTIAALYLRLLLEQDLGVTGIAVTTFTDAAAQELRERLRHRLREAEALASRMREARPDDAVDAWLEERWQQEERRLRERLRLRLALSELDLAPIGTLHALCRKVLAEQPFAAGSGFRPGELVSERSLRDELLADLRRHLSHTPADAQQEQPLQALAEMGDADLSQLIGHILDPDCDLRLIDADWREQLLACFTPERADAMEALAARPVWQPRKSKLKNQLLNMATLLRAGDPWVELDAKATVLHPPDPSDQVRAEQVAEVERDAGLLALVETVDRLRMRKAALCSDALRDVLPLLRHWRRQRLAEREQFTFDDLIERVRDAVRSSDDSATSLASTLFASWPVALIDEFQDTDSRQYAIFDRIYRDAAGAPRGLLVMIGDPKQAIYAFRGGDIHTYLRAARQATQRMSLATNFRSSRAYVEAMNGFYALAGDGFGAAGIAYHDVAASSRCDGRPLRRDGVDVAKPLCIEMAAAEGFPGNAAERQTLALTRCANAIADWLQPGRACIGDRSLQPGQIAVLLPSNRQIVELRALLQARHVPCVGAGRSTVFASPWAEALRLVLHALLDPGDAPSLRAALASALLGFDFAAIAALRDDEDAWARQVERFHRLARHWRERGPLAVVIELLHEAGPRLLAQHEGERALTDLRQLGELLQQQSERQPGAEQLLAWFAGQCEDGSDEDASEEAQLRIESDQQRVQLLTLHASKGLEFDLVFLPLMSLHNGRDPRFASAIEGERRVVDLGTPAETVLRARAADEDQRERLRVLYVALTRARYYCHVLAMPLDRPRDGRGQQPLGDPQRSALDRVLAQIGAVPDGGACTAIQWCHGWASGTVRLVPDASARSVMPQVPAMPARRPWSASHSFSSLIRGARQGQGDEETAAADEPSLEMLGLAAVDDDEPQHPALQALSALRGTAFGNAVHAVFESRDLSRSLLDQRELLLVSLRNAGVAIDAGRDGLLRELGRRLDACLQCDLGGGLRLGDLAPSAQRAEMAFHFELRGAGLDALRGVLAAHGRGEWLPESLGGRRLRGFLTGKIDLLLHHDGRVHVLDYKSNHLGERLADYRGAALDAAMREHHYPLQALLYTVALDRYLRQRRPDYRREQHLGDAIYLFVRAAGLSPESGIWRHHFEPDLIVELDAAFADAEAQNA